MTQRYILDENVVILAQKRENDHEEPDDTCLTLFNQIIEICHTIVFDPILWDKCYDQLRWLPPDQPHGPRSLLRLFYQALQRDGKIENSRRDAPGFPEEGDIPPGSQNHVSLVRLAVESGATLVTTDNPLIEDLNSCGVQEKYGLQVLLPEQALSGL